MESNTTTLSENIGAVEAKKRILNLFPNAINSEIIYGAGRAACCYQ